MMRVLEVVLNAEGTVGGEQRHVLQIIDGLEPDRYRADVVTWDIPEFVDELRAHGIDALPVSGTHILDRRLAQKLTAHMRSGEYDLVHAHGHRAGLIGRLAALRAGVPFIVWTCHVAENKADRNQLVGKGYELALQWLARRTDATVAVSPSVRDWLVDMGIPKAAIEVIFNCVDTRAFAPRPPSPRICKELGLDAGKPVVGTIARLHEQKGLDWLIDTVPLVLDKRPGTQFVIVGGGPAEEELKHQASALGVAHAITFAGQRGDVSDIVATFDVGVLPSRWEGFSYVPLEMMAMRKPMICSNIRSFSDFITNGRNGFTVEFGKVDSLAETILGVLDDPTMASAVAGEGYALVRREFDLPVMQRRTIALYDELLSRKAP